MKSMYVVNDSTDLLLLFSDLFDFAMGACSKSKSINCRHAIEGLTLPMKVLDGFPGLLRQESSFHSFPPRSMALRPLLQVFKMGFQRISAE
jgi:hypothetical protein